jgi:phenylpropionate dioxygenase-like ring-hydroxylating dioxygenase large terminal subunit
VYEAEQRRLFRRAWLFAGHSSELPAPGDYLTVTLAGIPVLLVRQPDHSLKAMVNRCAHKGTALFTERTGHTAQLMRCPYHGWTYRTDGTLQNIPLRQHYENTGFDQCSASRGLSTINGIVDYRGFLFIRLGDHGPGFTEYFGPALQAIDNMVDRSPAGELRLVGPPLQHQIRCNWKIYLENINDAMHPVSAHQSAWATAQKHWRNRAPDEPKPMAIEQMLPFGAGYEFFDAMGARILPNGHSFFGTQANIHSAYSAVDDYASAMKKSYGDERCAEILGFQSQNTVLYPTLSVKPSPLSMRVLRPVNHQETILEVWAFEAVDAPQKMLERALTYNRVAFSPMSVVAHDDIHLFESIQQTLPDDLNPWISLHRQAHPGASSGEGSVDKEVGSSDEALMRNQFKAWAALMRGDDDG